MSVDPTPLTLREAQAQCVSAQDQRYFCNLPEDCALCKRYQCNRCKGVYPWWYGGGDEAPGLCDACWCDVIGPWHKAQDAIDAAKRKHREMIGTAHGL